MIILKKPERGDDLKFIQWLWSDEETMQDVGGTHCYDDEGIEKWYVKNFESDKNNMDYFLIFSQQENIPVGEVSYVIDDYEKMIARFNIKIASKYRGKGYPLEAVHKCLDYFFNKRGGKIMRDDVWNENKTGHKFLLKAGFRYVKDVKEEFNGRIWESKLYEITSEIFNKLEN